jgi:signal transduction histidine kinase/ActR/RegA family two-component response regulator
MDAGDGYEIFPTPTKRGFALVLIPTVAGMNWISTTDAPASSGCQRAPAPHPALGFACGLLANPSMPLQPDQALSRLARLFGANRAGWAGLLADKVVISAEASTETQPADGENRSLEKWPCSLLAEAQRMSSHGLTRSVDGRNFLVSCQGAQAGAAWLLWIEGRNERRWRPSDKAALTLALAALVRAAQVSAPPQWTSWLDRARRQQCMEAAAAVVSWVIHDFNNILTGVLGFAELSLGQTGPGTPCHQYMTEVYQAAQQGSQLISRLSLFGRRSIIRPQPTELAPVLEVETTLARQHWESSIVLTMDLAHSLPSVVVEPETLRLVIAQLLENAREAAAAVGSVTVSARPVELTAADCLDLLGTAGPGYHVELAVTDTGPGFSPEARQKVLVEPFFSTKPRHRGLGLAAVYGAVFTSGGGLRIAQGSSGGAVVQVYWPAARREAPSHFIRRSQLPLAKGERVLIVDDDPLTLQLMRTTLERAGYQVQSAADGVQALDSFSRAAEPFRLVLADVVMPRMTGLDLARQLLDRDPQVNVLFTSGHVPAGSVPDSLAGCHFGLLPKPFRPEGLLRAVRGALDRDAPSALLSAAGVPPEKSP